MTIQAGYISYVVLFFSFYFFLSLLIYLYGPAG
jgi:hypothetical protein